MFLQSSYPKKHFPKPTGLGIYQRKKENEQESNHARLHKKENSVKKTRMRSRKKELAQESTHSTKKTSMKKNDNGQESNQETMLSVKKIKMKDSSCFNWSDQQIVGSKLIDISPDLKKLFFLGREHIFFTIIFLFFNEFFFSWTLSWSWACFLEQVLFFLEKSVFSCFLTFFLSFLSFS